MTRKEAIEVLNMVEAHGSLVIQAKEMAIKALEEESYMERWAKILNSEVNKMYIWCCPRCGTTMEVKER